ncbi:cell division protein ZapE [Pseudoalteromonas mariniglutinosa]|uniref:cell division protein ZapE n=1 Tax=Pseudoalteromonas mariniglutinosa TaxID=206042 RepID=UPI00384ADCA2
MTVPSGQILQHYYGEIEKGELQLDEAQLIAVTALDELAAALQIKRAWWQQCATPKGIYLYGPVGRGKSMLMDIFFATVVTPKKIRLHFHHFMAQVHQRLTELQGHKNPLQQIAIEWSARLKLICFDEFFVNDIGDAMIMAGLFKALFAQGVILVATSNSPPEQLYYNGLQRVRFLATIELINAHCQVINVAGDIDHRYRFGYQHTHYLINDSHALLQRFITDENSLNSDALITIHQRQLAYIKRGHEAILFDFMALCSGPRSTADYIYLAEHFQRVYIINVPIMGQGATGKQIVHGIEDSYQREKQDLQEHNLDDEARRFIALVDEFYDRNKLLIISARADIADLYQGEKLAFSYARTESRLVEMQSW